MHNLVEKHLMDENDRISVLNNYKLRFFSVWDYILLLNFSV